MTRLSAVVLFKLTANTWCLKMQFVLLISTVKISMYDECQHNSNYFRLGFVLPLCWKYIERAYSFSHYFLISSLAWLVLLFQKVIIPGERKSSRPHKPVTKEGDKDETFEVSCRIVFRPNYLFSLGSCRGIFPHIKLSFTFLGAF